MAGESLFLERENVDRAKLPHPKVKRRPKDWILSKTPGKFRVIHVIQVVPVAWLPNIIRSGYDKIALFRLAHHFLPVYWAVFVSPEPCHVRKEQSLRQPWKLYLAAIERPSVPHVTDLGSSDRIGPAVPDVTVQGAPAVG